MTSVSPLKAEELYRPIDEQLFSFETTNDLPDLDQVIGQPRAVEAVRFGIGIQQKGYNIFALGPNGAGKKSLLTQFFRSQAKNEPVPPDWCYVYNFEREYIPNAIRFPPGRGAEFKSDMENLVEDLRSALSSAFESDEFQARRQVLEHEYESRQEKALEEIQQRAAQVNLAFIRTPGGIVFAPMANGEVMPPEEFQKLPSEQREEIEKNIEKLQEELQTMLQLVPNWQREAREKMEELEHEITKFAAAGLLKELHAKYSDVPEVNDYLSALEKDILENSSKFLRPSKPEDAENPLAALIARNQQDDTPLRRYQVNLLVDHNGSEGAPVIYEDNPSYQNLVGRIDHLAQMGALVTDYTMIKPGSLHKANGGYLILDAVKVLQHQYAWEALKRALKSQRLHVESIGQMLSLITTVSLEPEPIPLDVKVALLGDRMLYYMLSQHDPDFCELFKVQADFAEEMPRDDENIHLYANLIAQLIRKNDLKPFDRGGVARILEHASRVVSDKEKFSIQVRDIANLLREADYWASARNAPLVQRVDVQQAIDAQIYRADRTREQMHEEILRDTIMISTQGERVGQINGLSVLQLGGFAFGTPSRITARVRLGKGDVINIEREVNMSGPIHSKGVLILSAFLGSRYSQEHPLSLSASLVFEQSYSGVEGDSASSTELYALLSAIANVPVKQSLAVTGSVNQHGDVQPIGGVNEKIEGYFDICKARGLTGEQGVLIPRANVKHIMLRRDVVEAVEQGKFFVYPVEHVDQGIEILTGIPAGERDDEGNYPKGSINARVFQRLEELAQKSRAAFTNNGEGMGTPEQPEKPVNPSGEPPREA